MLKNVDQEVFEQLEAKFGYPKMIESRTDEDVFITANFRNEEIIVSIVYPIYTHEYWYEIRHKDKVLKVSRRKPKELFQKIDSINRKIDPILLLRIFMLVGIVSILYLITYFLLAV